MRYTSRFQNGRMPDSNTVIFIIYWPLSTLILQRGKICPFVRWQYYLRNYWTDSKISLANRKPHYSAVQQEHGRHYVQESYRRVARTRSLLFSVWMSNCYCSFMGNRGDTDGKRTVFIKYSVGLSRRKRVPFFLNRTKTIEKKQQKFWTFITVQQRFGLTSLDTRNAGWWHS